MNGFFLALRCAPGRSFCLGVGRFDIVAVERSRLSIAIETNNYDAAVEPSFDDRSDLACKPRAALRAERAQLKTIAGLRFQWGVGQGLSPAIKSSRRIPTAPAGAS